MSLLLRVDRGDVDGDSKMEDENVGSLCGVGVHAAKNMACTEYARELIDSVEEEAL